MELTPNQRFTLSASPTEWHSYADELMDSARILLKEVGNSFVASTDYNGGMRPNRPTVSRSYILLSGFALENALKGLLVAQEPTHIINGALSNKIKNHSLLNLVSIAKDLTLTEAEKTICNIAQEAIPYWGRYPVPLRSESLKEEQILNDEFVSVIERLFQRVQKMSYETFKNGWQSSEGLRLQEYRNSQYE
ncbi:hypothetical protein DXT99_13460 [Pontibacter diazotrophicus]|uniref:HEPN domain-containing protein n=1 Tax=Pontibacter diazotrophicus TaxID=1400979 RepID=A0A3D8LB60_9BACT|nr:hypothetical protein [Pontibacter diazotrophicus]RDV14669.1 hypothetical protein DXT99_13460 [Pontibacter diazotrophicus]